MSVMLTTGPGEAGNRGFRLRAPRYGGQAGLGTRGLARDLRCPLLALAVSTVGWDGARRPVGRGWPPRDCCAGCPEPALSAVARSAKAEAPRSDLFHGAQL